MRLFTDLGEHCMFFPREVDLGSRGRCRVLFTPENLHAYFIAL